MSEKVYAIWLRDDQLPGIQALFSEKGWKLELETMDSYRKKEEVASEYVDTSNPSLTDRDEKRFENMKKIGTTYKQSFKESFISGVRKQGVPLPGLASPPGNCLLRSPWHVLPVPESDSKEGVEVDTSAIHFQHFLVARDQTVKLIVRLSTEHVHIVSRVSTRIVLLVDKSGSMLHKIGRDCRHTKIGKVTQFAKQLVTSLDEGDEVGLVTFGEDAEVFFPLAKITDKSRPLLEQRVQTLDLGSMSRKTNLSAGLRMALKVFFDASNCESDYLEKKNTILIFTDGDINAGTTETNALLHEVRQNIRQMVPKLDDSQNQWVTISVVTTGSKISDQAYMLSKTCSSDAYYYINKDSEDPEADLFLPVLLRKTAVAWNLSYIVETFHGIRFDDEKCSRDNRIRLRRSVSKRAASAEKAFFLYDFPAGHSRQIGVASSKLDENSFKHLQDDEVLFKLRVQYTNIKGERLWQEQMIMKKDLINAFQGLSDSEAKTAACKHELQVVSGDVLRNAAEHMRVGDKAKSKDTILDGQKCLHAILNEYGERSRQESQTSNTSELQLYAKSVIENLGELIHTVEKYTESEAWNKMKAVSTAIIRQTPNMSGTVVDSEILCPFPKIDHMETEAMAEPLHLLQAKKKEKS